MNWVVASRKNLTTISITHGHGDHWFGIGALLEHFPNANAVATPDVVKVMRLRASPINGPFAGVIRSTNCLIPVIVVGAVTGFIVSKAVAPLLSKLRPQPSSNKL